MIKTRNGWKPNLCFPSFTPVKTDHEQEQEQEQECGLLKILFLAPAVMVVL